jgi:hypothetical protein
MRQKAHVQSAMARTLGLFRIGDGWCTAFRRPREGRLSACTLYQGLFVMKDQDDQEGTSRLSQETGAEGCAPDVSRGRRLDNL